MDVVYGKTIREGALSPEAREEHLRRARQSTCRPHFLRVRRRHVGGDAYPEGLIYKTFSHFSHGSAGGCTAGRCVDEKPEPRPPDASVARAREAPQPGERRRGFDGSLHRRDIDRGHRRTLREERDSRRVCYPAVPALPVPGDPQVPRCRRNHPGLRETFSNCYPRRRDIGCERVPSGGECLFRVNAMFHP